MIVTNSHRAHDLRLRQVLLHIDQHLAAPLDLPSLAEVAHFSPFHFHRVFAAWMGERLGDYLRRRRLEVAAAAGAQSGSGAAQDRSGAGRGGQRA